MKKLRIVSILIFALLLSACNTKESFRVLNKGIASDSAIKDVYAPSNDNDEKNKYQALNYDEQKAIWISYIELADFLSGGDEASFKSKFSQALDSVKASGFNTVYVHVRAFGDAYYDSGVYPKALIISSDFDPLEIMTELSHKQGISFHAWINPFRCMSYENMETIDDSFQTKKWFDQKGNILKSVPDNTNYWLNPAYDEVLKLINSGVKEIVENYEVDGIHFDDYFFPTPDESFDRDEFEKSGESSLSDYRISRINKMVSGVYKTIKDINKSVLFGLSPQGNIKNDYASQFADVKKWCAEEGFCDYIAPQVYYGYESVCPYDETIKTWSDMCKDSSVRLVIGLGEYKILSEEEFISTKGIIANMINDAKKLDCYSGVAIYNYKNLFAADEENAERVMAEKELIEKAIK